jgi:hypothetical protein
VERIADGGGVPAPAPTTTASEPMTGGLPPTTGGAGVRETVEQK